MGLKSRLDSYHPPSAVAGTLPPPRVLASNPSSPVRNSANAGIGRLSICASWLTINNLGRNIELASLAQASQPVSRGRFAQTDFPEEDELSLLDLDAHAILTTESGAHFMMINHFGLIRAFDVPPSAAVNGEQQLLPTGELRWLGDVERYAVSGGRLWSTSPRGHQTTDRARPGIFVSAPLLPAMQMAASTRTRIELERHQLFAACGHTTALAVGPVVAFAGEDAIVVADACITGKTPRVMWQRSLGLSCQWLEIESSQNLLMAAGPSNASEPIGADDWDLYEGGAICAFDLRNGDKLFEQSLAAIDIAWGYGSQPLAYASWNRKILGVTRRGALYEFDLHGSHPRQLFRESAERHLSYGLGHLALYNQTAFAGFNRGGYRLFVYSLSP